MDARVVRIKNSIRKLKHAGSKEHADDTEEVSKARKISLSKLPSAPLFIDFHLENGRTVKRVKPGTWDRGRAGTWYMVDVDRDEAPQDKSIPRLQLGLPVVALPRFGIENTELPSIDDEPASPGSPIWGGWEDHHIPRHQPAPSIMSQETWDGTVTSGASTFAGSTLLSRSSSMTSATTMRSHHIPVRADSLSSSSNNLAAVAGRGSGSGSDKSPLATRTTDYHSFVYSPTTTNGSRLPTIDDIAGGEEETSESESGEEEYHLSVIKPPRRNWVNFSFRHYSEFLPEG